ncbi:carboxypeptidase B1-like [Topomyia yanbarensis]|uniref:carboxypeptidase B1-like n=1 Tax=Topomyia yanbarensis TaxID=2498891 RepID=UPI00273B4441|nr:carboxypeptidase B1-like [Topomyia yanbarensis]
MILKIIIVPFAMLAVVTARHSYQGYKVYEVQQKTREQANFLYELEQSNSNLDFWHLSKRLNDKAQVLVPPKEQRTFVADLMKNGFQYSVLVHDVENTIDDYSASVASRKPVSAEDRILHGYLRHSDVNQYLDELASKFPAKVKVEQIATSYEGRPLKTITINDKRNNSVIFLDAGIHAREWIAPATALYAINQLVENANENADILSNLTWVILPVVNPDGYEYSHQMERFWRKTRKPAGKCIGTDGNRNFDFHWGEVGASSSACSETYKGDAPFSEPETRAVRDEISKLKGQCKFYLSLHSYGNYLLYPWGYTSDLPDTWRDIDEVAQAGAAAIEQATGTKYTVGSSTNELYAAAGGSDDWAFAKADVPVAIVMELPGGGFGGFNPPASSIETSVKESWVGIRAMARKVAQKY